MDLLPPIVPSPQPQIVRQPHQHLPVRQPQHNAAARTARWRAAADVPAAPAARLPGTAELPAAVRHSAADGTRFITDEVVLQVRSNIAIADLENALRRFGLTLLASDRLGGTTDTIVLRFRITNGQSVRDIIRQLASVQIVALAQPNYYFLADQKASPPPPRAAMPPSSRATPRNTSCRSWRISEVHRLVRGTNVPIAVIDSEIDAAHPDLQGVVAQRFSAVGAPENAARARHRHGRRDRLAPAAPRRRALLPPARGARVLHQGRPAPRARHSTSSRASTGR